MPSTGTSRYTTVAAFKKADDILGPDRVNTPSNEEQASWLANVYAPCSQELSGIKEIDSNATFDPADHIGFMQKHGWSSALDATEPGDLLLAGVLDVLALWKAKGLKTTLDVRDVGTFPAVRLGKNVSFRRHKASGTIVATLATKTSDEVLIALAGRDPSDVLALNADADDLFGAAEPSHDNEGILFPMVDLASKQSLSWIVGLRSVPAKCNPYSVAQAVQQSTFRMNDEGARARVADEMVMRATSVRIPKPPLVIDRPFLVGIRRPGLSHLLFSAYVDRDAWKDPGGLGI